MSNLTYERLRSVISYDPDSGIAIWLPRTPSMFKEGHHSADNSCASWNARNAGKIAGGIAANGYYNISIDGERYQIHRVIFFYMTERWPIPICDHRDGDASNNKWNNLRETTQGKNTQNKSIQSNNKLGIKWVNWDKQHRKYVAHIRTNSKNRHLGYFDCPAAAHLVAFIEADKHFGEFARSR